MTLALLDGDIIAYRAACGMQQTYDWGDTGGKVHIPDVTGATEEAVKLAQQWADSVNATDVMVAFTSSDKFRTRILPTYKANRPSEKPAAHAAAVQAIKDRYQHRLIHGLEADDILGILATRAAYRDKAVIVSLDKDFKTIPCRLCNPDKDRLIHTIEPPEADFWWMYQTLVGDSTDNYKGCPKVGPVNAPRILRGELIGKFPTVDVMWPRVVAAFKAKRLSEEDALVQARVARILRNEDYDKATKRIRLWHPTEPIYIPVEQG